MENNNPQPIPLTSEISQPSQTPPESSHFLRLFFLGLILILFGILIGVLAARFLPMTSSPVISETTPNPTAISWKTYFDNSANFSINYPASLIQQEATYQNGHVILLCENAVIPPSDGSGYNFCDSAGISITYDSEEGRGGACDYYSTILVAGEEQQVCKDSVGLSQLYFGPTVGNNHTFSIVAKYSSTFTEETVNKIISSFEFTNAITSEKYICPSTSYVDCMPSSDSSVQKLECTSEFLSWATANCPNFQGAAL